MSAMKDLTFKNEDVANRSDSKLDQLRNQIIQAATAQSHAAVRQEGALSDLSSKLTAFVKEGEEAEKDQRIVERLLFKEIKLRKSDIDPAYIHTLQWMFDRKRATFANWLESQGGIYWVNGQVCWHFSTDMIRLC